MISWRYHTEIMTQDYKIRAKTNSFNTYSVPSLGKWIIILDKILDLESNQDTSIMVLLEIELKHCNRVN